MAQHSISIFLHGMATKAILFGHLSGVFVGKKILILSTIISLIGTALYLYSPSMKFLILGRLFKEWN